jgi:hypothetical protein
MLKVVSALLLISLISLVLVVADLAKTTSEMSMLQAGAEHPTVGIWDSCAASCTIKSEAYRAGSVPDTFTTHLSFRSDVSLFWAFLTLDQYVTFQTFSGVCSFLRGPLPAPTPDTFSRAANCLFLILRPGPSATGQSIFATGLDGEGTEVNVDFHLAEGCASYLSVITPSVAGESATIVPRVTATYNPAQKPTGACVGG